MTALQVDTLVTWAYAAFVGLGVPALIAWVVYEAVRELRRGDDR